MVKIVEKKIHLKKPQQQQLKTVIFDYAIFYMNPLTPCNPSFNGFNVKF